MKKIICFIIFVLTTNTNIFAYQIQARDKVTYEYKDGKPEGNGIPQSWLFEVDEEKKTIKEIAALATYKGTTVDMVKGYEVDLYAIVYNEDNNMVAVKTGGRNVEILEFRNNGTYTAFLSTTIPTVGEVLDIDGTYSIVTFGTYSKLGNE